MLRHLLSLTVLTIVALAPISAGARESKYAESNRKVAALPAEKRQVVLLGNSITEFWAKMDPAFFTDNGFVGRGISGQTSTQIAGRFASDVMGLHPRMVIINAGTNDVAENGGPYSEDTAMGNIRAMVALARAAGIEPVLTSVLPAARFGWRPSVTDGPEKIASLNARIRAYADAEGLAYIDYFPLMVAGDGRALNPAYSEDGVHPNPAGYEVMEKAVLETISPKIVTKSHND